MEKFRMNEALRLLKVQSLAGVCLGLGVEAVLPVLVLAGLLPGMGLALNSPEAATLSCSYALVASALKVLFVDKAKGWFVARNRQVEFYLGSAINYSLVAIALLKLFELTVF